MSNENERVSGTLRERFTALVSAGIVALVVVVSDERVIWPIFGLTFAGAMVYEHGIMPVAKYAGISLGLIVGAIILLAAIGGVAMIVAPRLGYEIEELEVSESNVE